MAKQSLNKFLGTYNKGYKLATVDEHNFNEFIINLQNYFKDLEHADMNNEVLLKGIFKDNLLKNYNNNDYKIWTEKDRIDLTILKNYIPRVIFEFKSPLNKAQMLQIDNEDINRKALQQAIYYFYNQGKIDNITDINNIVITDAENLFFFNPSYFLHDSLRKIAPKFKKQKTEIVYELIKEKITDKKIPFEYAEFNLYQYKQKILNNNLSKNDIQQLQYLYKALHPDFLLQEYSSKNVNILNKYFYEELLYIMGLKEEKVGNKIIIKRDKSIIHSYLNLLYKEISRRNISEEKAEELSLELVLTWINRFLFIKLFEGQLLAFNNGEQKFKILEYENKFNDFKKVQTLFSDILCKKIEDRESEDFIDFNDKTKEDFNYIPYLNSSLFEGSKAENDNFINIGIIQQPQTNIKLYAKSNLKSWDKYKNKNYEPNLLEYTIDFLNSYIFTSENTKDTNDKSIINASVLGLIFEKINGYKDGAYFTPSTITEYMAKKCIEDVFITKFNKKYKKRFKTYEEVKTNLTQNNLNKHEISDLINTITICDPAVGSGHFLVSCLNQMIALKADLCCILKHNSNEPLTNDCIIEVINDEIVVRDAQEEIIKYDKTRPITQTIQETLFNEKRTIIENCLFGVDINPKSVLICQLRLWIELLKHAYYKNGIMETLPNIDINIKCGNSLLSKLKFEVGNNRVETENEYITNRQKRDLRAYIKDYKNLVKEYKNKNYTTANEKHGLLSKISSKKYEIFLILNDKRLLDKISYENAMEWAIEFPEILDDSGKFLGFDVVIGNPPYIGQKGNKSLFEPFKKIEQWKNFYERKQDLYYYFIVKGIDLLSTNGVFSYIIPPYFTSAEGGKNLRQYIVENSNIHKIVNLNGKIKVFENASIDNLILFLNKKDKNKPIIIEEPNLNNDLFMENMTAYLSKFSTNRLSYKEWYIFKDNDIVEIKSTNTVPLGQIATISPGIQTGCDKVSNSHIKNITDSGIRTGDGIFVISDTEKENLCLTDYEKKFVKPFYKNSDIFKFGYKQQKKEWIIITNKIDNIDTCPNLKQHLLKYKQILDARYRNFALINADKEGKWWYLYGYRPNTNFDDEKIVLPYRSKDNNFAYSNKSIYGSIDIFFININNYEYNTKYINAILCSKLLFYWLNHNCKRKGTTFEFYQKPLSVIPIKKSDKKTQNEFIVIVDKILALTQTDDYLENQEKQDAVKKYENQIDIMVYKLYNLTYNEVLTIDKEFNLTEEDYHNFKS